MEKCRNNEEDIVRRRSKNAYNAIEDTSLPCFFARSPAIFCSICHCRNFFLNSGAKLLYGLSGKCSALTVSMEVVDRSEVGLILPDDSNCRRVVSSWADQRIFYDEIYAARNAVYIDTHTLEVSLCWSGLNK